MGGLLNSRWEWSFGQDGLTERCGTPRYGTCTRFGIRNFDFHYFVLLGEKTEANKLMKSLKIC